ncbi:MAG: hypothetical protein JXR62_06610 [Bacilli bacterium]|nr:hypothetical protein [Bacilli bacterium]
MKKLLYLMIAVVGNALGTALMSETELGMTAWGSGVKNFSNTFNLTLGVGFIILSVFFYIAANVIRRRVDVMEFLQSFLFLFTFGLLTDLFIMYLPQLSELQIIFRILVNTFGLLILLFSIALHLRVYLAVHPMDVFLSVIQHRLNSVSKGTYLVYIIAFSLAIIFGLWNGHIVGIGIGTINTLIGSGLIMDFFDKKVVLKWFVKGNEKVN